MKYINRVISIFILSSLIVGCTDTIDDDLDKDTNNKVEIEERLKEVNSQLEDKNNQYLALEEQLKNYKLKNKSWINEEKFKWMKTEKWDSVLISKTFSKNDRFIINNQDFKGSYYWLFAPLKKVDVPPNGFHSDVEDYSYIFTKDSNSYVVNIVDRSIVEIEGEYYKANRDVHNLGKAFLPSYDFLNEVSVLSKIYQSGALIGKKQLISPIFSSFRIRGFVKALWEMMDSGDIISLSKKPKDIGDTIESFKFYYYGDEIVMDIYENFITIKDGNNVKWYEIKDSEIYNNIFSIVTAG